MGGGLEKKGVVEVSWKCRISGGIGGGARCLRALISFSGRQMGARTGPEPEVVL